MTIQGDVLADKYRAVKSSLNERGVRMWAAAEARSLGHGGIKAAAKASGLSRRTVERGLNELAAAEGIEAISGMAPEVSRRSGGGRKKLQAKDSSLLEDLDKMVDPMTRGHPENVLRWTAKSTAKLATELQIKGHIVSERSVASLLKKTGYSLQAMRKTKEGGKHVDRDAQFRHIAETVRTFHAEGQPAVSIDAKKKELVGTFANKGREWQPKGSPEQANVYDFIDKELGKVTPYGIYDLKHNIGWVSVGIDHDTAEFAVQTLMRWWTEMGKALYPHAKRLLITADGGGSNGSRVRLWKVALQRFAKETGLEVLVCHFPPGTSKWNKIEHRMFAFISLNWRGRALATRQIIVNLIGETTTDTGLKIRAALDESTYPVGRKVSDAEMNALNLTWNAFHPDWNYSIK